MDSGFKLFLLAYIFVIFVFLVHYRDCIYRQQCIFAEDFSVFYDAGVKVINGQAGVIYEPERIKQYVAGNAPDIQVLHPFLNPPFAIPIFAPLGLVAKNTALVLWYAAQFVLLYGVLNSRQFALLVPRLASNRVRYNALITILFLPFFLFTIFAGQLGILTAALFLLGLLYREKAPFLSGLSLGVLCAKPQTAILLPIVLLVRKNFKAIAYAVGVLSALSIAVVLLWGGGIFHQYLLLAHNYSELFGAAPEKYKTISASAFMSLMQVGVERDMAFAMQLLVSAIVAAAVWKVASSALSEQDKTVFYIFSSFLVSPYISLYDTVILPAALLIILERAITDKVMPQGKRLGFILVAFIPLVGSQLHSISFPYAFVSIAFMWALMANGMSNRRRLEGKQGQ